MLHFSWLSDSLATGTATPRVESLMEGQCGSTCKVHDVVWRTKSLSGRFGWDLSRTSQSISCVRERIVQRSSVVAHELFWIDNSFPLHEAYFFDKVGALRPACFSQSVVALPPQAVLLKPHQSGKDFPSKVTDFEKSDQWLLLVGEVQKFN